MASSVTMEAVFLPGLLPVTLNVIVYQYGKVASTSLVTTFIKMRGVSAHQCHFFGEDALQAQGKISMVIG